MPVAKEDLANQDSHKNQKAKEEKIPFLDQELSPEEYKEICGNLGAYFSVLKSRLSYTMSEIAKLYGIHVRTVQEWHKQGLTPIDSDHRPILFMGYEVKRFLEERKRSRKVKLKSNEFYCPRCRAARISDPKYIHIIDTNRRIGKSDFSVYIKGVCIICSCKLTRFSTRKRAKTSVFVTKLTQADRVLESDFITPVNTDLRGGLNHANEC
jgi:hypothetical protein